MVPLLFFVTGILQSPLEPTFPPDPQAGGLVSFSGQPAQDDGRSPGTGKGKAHRPDPAHTNYPPILKPMERYRRIKTKTARFWMLFSARDDPDPTNK
jgi:hypothetical protein